MAAPSGIRFGVGPLAHLLRNRFYIGEVVYRGKVHHVYRTGLMGLRTESLMPQYGY
jgi:hypothetical protein